MEEHSKMFSHVGTMLNAVEEVQPPAQHSEMAEQWWDNMEREWNVLCAEADSSDNFREKGQSILECFQLGYSHLQKSIDENEKRKTDEDLIKTKEHIQVLLAKPQSVQRTAEWYDEMRNVLSASEFYKLFGTARMRAELIMSKIKVEEGSSTRRTCCLTMEMSPFDWGIRFEPIAKQILESMWGVQIAELGRIHHPIRKGLAASPDGLIVESEKDTSRLGNLIEIKCPSSREIKKIIPAQYWHQMQLQLEVAGAPLCEYCEFTFRSHTAKQQKILTIPEEVEQKGNIFILQKIHEPQMVYEYSPLNNMEWEPTVKEGWEVVEKIPWYLEKYWIQPVKRDQAWFESIVPLIEHFWKDVEKAKAGEFIFPESSSSGKKRAVACGITDDQ